MMKTQVHFMDLMHAQWLKSIKKMIDDVKVILAEYRLALKIYNNKLKK